eukprot:1120177-Alexandrium_andersonii.AAC.1
MRHALEPNSGRHTVHSKRTRRKKHGAFEAHSVTMRHTLDPYSGQNCGAFESYSVAGSGCHS